MAHDCCDRYNTTWPRLLEKRGLLVESSHNRICALQQSVRLDEFIYLVDGNRETSLFQRIASSRYYNSIAHAQLFNHTSRNERFEACRNEKSKARSAEAIARNVIKLAVEARRHRGVHGVSKDLQIIVVSPPEIVFNEESKEMGYTRER